MKKPDRRTQPRTRPLDPQELAQITGGNDSGVEPSAAYKSLGPKVSA